MQTRHYLNLIAALTLLFIVGCSTTSSKLPAVEYGPDNHEPGTFQDWKPKPL